MGNFSETINWPAQKDQWPTLYNDYAGPTREHSILFAEHFNKIRNFVVKSEGLWLNATTGSGDGSLRGLSYVYTLETTISEILGSFAFDAWNSPSISQPGNVLPFEFVITSSNDNYSNWPANGQGTFRSMLVQDTVDAINTIVAGMDFFNIYPMVTIAIAQRPGIQTDPSSVMYLANGWANISSDTLLIRGAIIDLQMPNDSGNNWVNTADRWKTQGLDLLLRASIIGVRT